MLKRQDGRCHACELYFIPQALLEVHHLNGDHRTKAYSNLATVHRHCHDQIHGGHVNALARTVLLTRVQSIEEPCASKGARPVLQTSEGSDPLTEFKRALRFPVLWRKLMQGTYNEKGDRWVERILSVRETCHLRGDPPSRCW